MAVNVNAPHQVFAELLKEGTAESIVANISRFVEKMQLRTIPNLRAQEKRQELTQGLRAGGAPGTHREAQAMVRELIGQFRQTGDATAQAAAGQVSYAQWRQQIRELAAAIKAANQSIPGKLAILFHSGGPFLYPSSTPADYAAMVAAGSKGRQVWNMGLGPDKHPAYVKIVVDPNEVIDSEFASSSWVIAYYLIYRP